LAIFSALPKMDAESEFASMQTTVNDDPDASCGLWNALRGKRKLSEELPDENECESNNMNADVDVPVEITVYPKYEGTSNDELSVLSPDEAQLPADDRFELFIMIHSFVEKVCLLGYNNPRIRGGE
jgi:hypothetical protein